MIAAISKDIDNPMAKTFQDFSGMHDPSQPEIGADDFVSDRRRSSLCR